MSTACGVSPRFCVAWTAEIPDDDPDNHNEIQSKKFTFRDLKFRLHFLNEGTSRGRLRLVLAKGHLTEPLTVTVLVETRGDDGPGCRALECCGVRELPRTWILQEDCYHRFVLIFVKNKTWWKRVSFVVIFEEDPASGRKDNIERPIECAEVTSKGPDFPSNLKNLSLDFSNLLKNETLPDLKLKCGGRDSAIPAHRAVLAARSEVFAAMFRNEMAESRSGEVDVSDIEDDVIDPFLRYVYTGKIPSGVSDRVVPGLYAAADKYAVHALRETCRERMVGGLTEDNCVDFLRVADGHGDADLKKSAIDFICGHEAVVKGDAWQELLQKLPSLATEVYDSIFDVVDLEDDVADPFLKYVESGDIPPGLSDEVVPRLYEAGDRYAVHALRDACRERMVSCLTEENCVGFLTLADAHGDAVFKKSVIEFVCSHRAVFKREDWREFTKKHSLLAIEVYQSKLDSET